ncbi:hypothetical protein M0R45_021701 [Rubus argutus]|uniref:Uncharacterized protein n=1 Tax=Rubus argutus TaxID=59490 RepID=A0AAW1XFP9_RUBAR
METISRLSASPLLFSAVGSLQFQSLENQRCRCFNHQASHPSASSIPGPSRPCTVLHTFSPIDAATTTAFLKLPRAFHQRRGGIAAVFSVI